MSSQLHHCVSSLSVSSSLFLYSVVAPRGPVGLQPPGTLLTTTGPPSITALSGSAQSKCWKCCVWSRVHWIFSCVCVEFYIHLDKMLQLLWTPNCALPLNLAGGLPSLGPPGPLARTSGHSLAPNCGSLEPPLFVVLSSFYTNTHSYLLLNIEDRKPYLALTKRDWVEPAAWEALISSKLEQRHGRVGSRWQDEDKWRTAVGVCKRPH